MSYSTPRRRRPGRSEEAISTLNVQLTATSNVMLGNAKGLKAISRLKGSVTGTKDNSNGLSDSESV